MKLHKWQDIRAKKLSPEKLRRIDKEVEQELLEMDLRALREAVGLTQEELARRVEVTQSQLSKLERPASPITASIGTNAPELLWGLQVKSIRRRELLDLAGNLTSHAKEKHEPA
jgi:DNA-binding transcriptional regulator YiaG